jgi:hypothetical protein
MVAPRRVNGLSAIAHRGVRGGEEPGCGCHTVGPVAALQAPSAAADVLCVTYAEVYVSPICVQANSELGFSRTPQAETGPAAPVATPGVTVRSCTSAVGRNGPSCPVETHVHGTAVRASLLAGARLLGLMVLIPIAACSSAMSLVDVEAARTTAQVMTALINDPEIGTRPIDVRVSRGIVTLSGRVRSEAEVARAIALARAVPGVTRVDSSIRVAADLPQAQPPPSDARPVARDPAVEFAELEQAPSRLAIGGYFGVSEPAVADLESAWSLGPILRFGSGVGFGPTVGFDWYSATLNAEVGAPASRIHVRPTMAGLAYTVVAGRVAISPSLVGGYAFNIEVPQEGNAGRLAIDVDNSLVWRPGVSVWVETSRRTAANLSVGLVRTRLNVTYVDAGAIEQRTMSGNATVVSIGLVYRLF